MKFYQGIIKFVGVGLRIAVRLYKHLEGISKIFAIIKVAVEPGPGRIRYGE